MDQNLFDRQSLAANRWRWFANITTLERLVGKGVFKLATLQNPDSRRYMSVCLLTYVSGAIGTLVIELVGHGTPVRPHALPHPTRTTH